MWKYKSVRSIILKKDTSLHAGSSWILGNWNKNNSKDDLDSIQRENTDLKFYHLGQESYLSNEQGWDCITSSEQKILSKLCTSKSLICRGLENCIDLSLIGNFWVKTYLLKRIIQNWSYLVWKVYV